MASRLEPTEEERTVTQVVLVNLGASDPLATDPLGIEMLAGTILGRNLASRVALVDQVVCPAERSRLDQILPRGEFDVVGLSCMWPNFEYLAANARIARAEFPQATIVAGGSAVEALGGVLLEDIPELDCVVRGEGEEALASIVAGDSLETVPNTYYRGETGIEINRRLQVEPLRSGLPDRSLLFRDGDSQNYPYVAANMEISRGCDFGACTFCHLTADAFFHRASSTARYERYRKAPMAAALEDYQLLLDIGVPRINFVDEEFFGGRGEPLASQGAEFLRELTRRRIGLGTPKKIFARAPDITDESISLMTEAGVATVFLGLEAGSSAELKIFAKGASIAHSSRAISLLRAAGIRLKAGFIMLHPLSKAVGVLENIRFLEENDLFANVKNSLGMLDVIPNSSYHRMLERAAPHVLFERDRHYPNFRWRPEDHTFEKYWSLISSVSSEYSSWADRFRVAHYLLVDSASQRKAAQAWLAEMNHQAALWLRIIALEGIDGRSRAQEIEARANDFLGRLT